MERVEKIDLSVPFFLSLHFVKAPDIGKEQSMGLYLPLCQEFFSPVMIHKYLCVMQPYLWTLQECIVPNLHISHTEGEKM